MDKWKEILYNSWKKMWSACKACGGWFKKIFAGEKAFRFYKRMLFPKPWMVFLCVVTALPLVIFALAKLSNTHPLSYVAYLYSAYAMTILCVNFPRMVRRTKELVHGDEVKAVVAFRNFMNRYKYTRLFLNDKEFRAKIALYVGLFVNLLYVVFRCATGIYYRSTWFLAIGVYYIMLSLIRFMLLHNVRMTDRQEQSSERRKQERKTYRNCGIMILLLNGTMSGMTVQMLWQNKGYAYPGSFIYISALFTFFCLITSIVNLVSFAKRKNLILRAAKNLSFVGALVSVLALQTAMLTSFGGEDEAFRQLMNTITGCCVSVLTMGIGIYMIVKGNKKEIFDGE